MQTGYPVRAHKKVQTFESASADYFIGFYVTTRPHSLSRETEEVDAIVSPTMAIK